MDRMLKENEAAEKRNRNMGLAITFGIFVLLLGISMYWVAFASTIPPIDELEWKTIGSVSADFGNEVEGSQEVNNFHKPSPTPADKPKVEPKSEPKSDPTPTKVTPAASPNMESNTESDQSVAKTEPVKTDPVAETTPATKPEEKPVENTNPTNETKTTTNNSNTTNGGSNDGNSNTTGNSGNPKAQVLNDDGMFQFGNGIGGPGGRMPLKIKMPDYNVQNEAKITFNFVIAPSGEVILVRPEMTMHTDLARIGADAIKRWRFTEVEPSRGNLRTTVTITFRLE